MARFKIVDFCKRRRLLDVRVEVEQVAIADYTQRPGRLGPRWLYDLYMGMLADERFQDVGDLFTRCEDLPHRLSLFSSKSSATSPAHGHELLSIESQCPQPTATSELISCMCRHCKYHFVFHFQQDSSITCANSEGSFEFETKVRLCHLVLVESKITAPGVEDVYNPVTCTGTWRCSSPSCSFQVSVSISTPRMKRDHIKLVLDRQRIANQRQQAIELDPIRFQNLKDDLEDTALATLNAYLRDCTNAAKDAPQKKIATRNKRFYIQFGDSCSKVFEYLGLEKKEVDDEFYWFLPTLEHYDHEKTPINTQRAFIEDARSEIQALMEEQIARLGHRSEEQVKPWTPARSKLLRALNCPWNDWKATTPQDDDNDLRILGTLPKSSDETIQYAFKRQIKADPVNKKQYFASLQKLAEVRSYELQLFAGTELSMIDHNETSSDGPVAEAYRHFNLPPDCAESDDFIIRKYKVFAEQSPAQKNQHRNKLFEIGKARKSQKIMAQAADNFSFEEACDYLQLDETVKQGSLPVVEALDYYISDVVQAGAPRYICGVAVTAIADFFNSQAINNFADQVKAQGYAELQAAHGDVAMPDTIRVAAAQAEQVDLSLPPGLDNLRNTCYLNSILQYFYTVTPVRELVLNFDPTAQGLSINLANQNEEVYLGREFVLELQRLFRSLACARGKFVKPEQRLANAAWLSPDKVNAADASQKNGSRSTPPPLPARPAPVPSTQSVAADATTTGPAADIATEDSPASTTSSQTLINNPLESSYEMMERDDQPAVIDMEKETKADAHPEAQSQLRALMAALDQTQVVGTDQMDVEEVMGRCINHLRAAINPASVVHANDDEHRSDIITETFYITFANMRMEMGADKYNRSVSHERWVTANPGVDGPVHLYEALDNFFDRETIGEKILSYTAIVKPPPIFHICIQRSKVGGGKNSNPVQIPEVLYLDRYMEAPEDSPTYRARFRSWSIKSQLEKIAAVKAAKVKTKKDEAVADPAPKAESTPTIDDSVDRYVRGWTFEGTAAEQQTQQLGTGVDDYVVIDPAITAVLRTTPEPDDSPLSSPPSSSASPISSKKPPTDIDLTVDVSPYVDNDIDTREGLLKAELEGLFAGMEREMYRLHAVICHAGQRATSGHYWVWIYDFTRRVWRKYNDTTVTERPEHETPALLAELSSAGEPYYLAYVRDEGKESLVAVPPRQIDAEGAPEVMEVDRADADEPPPPYEG